MTKEFSKNAENLMDSLARILNSIDEIFDANEQSTIGVGEIAEKVSSISEDSTTIVNETNLVKKSIDHLIKSVDKFILD